MIVVPAGEFMMGSPATEKGRYDDEGPQHEVTIARPFAVSKFDVTFADWDACVSVGGCTPVSDHQVWVARHDARLSMSAGTTPRQYVAWFSEMTGKPYRLLTEAEWEYAARAGNETAYSWGDEVGEENANCDGCGRRLDTTGDLDYSGLRQFLDQPMKLRQPLDRAMQSNTCDANMNALIPFESSEVRGCLGRRTSPVGFFRQCLRALRYGRQCLAMGGRLLSR